MVKLSQEMKAKTAFMMLGEAVSKGRVTLVHVFGANGSVRNQRSLEPPILETNGALKGNCCFGVSGTQLWGPVSSHLWVFEALPFGSGVSGFSRPLLTLTSCWMTPSFPLTPALLHGEFEQGAS